ncbi:peptidase s41 family protein [Zymoseptoria brevis]|uniref:Peptidase s41 family protein n=1 Tax=Zymoseptoria brevis TaxID=1047168 RepID=A0A0F4GSF7_9PEZI|nr:peptidase s41 family protein [Zymoseptoria brevis]
MLIHSLLIVGCTISTAAGSRHLGYDLKPKDSSLQPVKRGLGQVGVSVSLSQQNQAPYSANTTNPSNSTDTSCGKLMAVAQHLDQDGTVPADLSYQCLMSIPFHQADALFHIETLLPYIIGFHSDLAWVADPPEEYVANVKAPFDVLGCIDTVKAAVESGSYTSEYLFSLDLEQCFGLITFGRTYSLISASSDGESPAAIYIYDDIDAVASGDASFEPSPIVKINGRDPEEVLLEASKGAPVQDPDAAYNYMFGHSLRQPGLFTYGGPLFAWYPGPTTLYEFANGTQVVDQTVAFLDTSITPNASIQTGEDFYRSYVGWTTDCDANSVGAISVYDYSVCRKEFHKSDNSASSGGDASGNDGADTPPPGPVPPPPGYPVPVVSLNDSMVWGFFPEGEHTQDVAVLAVAAFWDVNEHAFDNTSFAEFLGDFFQQAADAKRTKLVIDLSQNLGGFENGLFQLYSALFPDLPVPVYGGDAAATDARNLMGQEYSYTVGVSDPDSLTQIQAWKSYNYRTDLDLDGNHFTSWEQKFGPAGSPFTPYWRSELFPSETARSPFTPENTVILSDGVLVSCAADFAELLILQASVRTVAIGGRPSTQSMQTVGGSRSYTSSTYLSVFQDVAAVFLEGKLHDPEFYNSTVLGEINVLPLIRSKLNSLALQLAQDPRDPSLIPMMYKYQPADCHIPYTLENVLDASARWKDAVAKAF